MFLSLYSIVNLITRKAAQRGFSFKTIEAHEQTKLDIEWGILRCVKILTGCSVAEPPFFKEEQSQKSTQYYGSQVFSDELMPPLLSSSQN
jgi:hypothetical protein